MEPSGTHSWKTDGEYFKSERSLRSVRYLGLLLFVLFGIMTWFFPLLIIAPIDQIITIVEIMIPALIVAAAWMALSYRTTRYRLTGSEMTRQSGIIVKRIRTVPYWSIKDVVIRQGPFARHFGIAGLMITFEMEAGQRPSRFRIKGIRHQAELREFILERAHAAVRPEQSVTEIAFHHREQDVPAQPVASEMISAIAVPTTNEVTSSVVISAAEPLPASSEIVVNESRPSVAAIQPVPPPKWYGGNGPDTSDFTGDPPSSPPKWCDAGVRDQSPASMEGRSLPLRTENATNEKILAELVRIRELLEKREKGV